MTYPDDYDRHLKDKRQEEASRDFWDRARAKMADDLKEYRGSDGVYRYPCVMCEREFPIECDLLDFDPDLHYCGGSERCCP